MQESVRQTPTVKPVENIKIPSASSEVEVSGNIKIASTIATSQIPMQEDLKTKTPTIHGTINMIAPANISAYSKSVETRKGDRVTVNTPRPFEVRPKYVHRLYRIISMYKFYNNILNLTLFQNIREAEHHYDH